MKKVWVLALVCAGLAVWGWTGCAAKDEPDGTASVQQPIALGENLLVNPNFERRDVAVGDWTVNPPVSAWEMSGNRWYQYRPSTNDPWPQPHLGAQYLWLGKDLDAVNTFAKQRIGTVKPGQRYKASVRIRRMATQSAGTISLQAFDGQSSWNVLAESSDWSSLSTGAWHALTLEYDTAAAATHAGQALYFVVRNGVSSTLIDNAEITVSMGTGLPNLVVNPGFEDPQVTPPYTSAQPIPDWSTEGHWWHFRSFSTATGCYPPSTTNQYVELGRNLAVVGTLSQALGTFDADAIYRVSARVWRRSASDPGGLFGLVATAPGTSDVVLGQANWSTAPTCPSPGGAWTQLEFVIDGADHLAADNRNLKVMLSSAFSPIFDDVAVTKDTQRFEPYAPSPPNAQTGVHRDDVVLSWRSGSQAAGHYVYLSTSLDDVAERAPGAKFTADGPSGLTYAPARLTAGATYYWRIEATGSQPPGSWLGPIWSFTVDDGKAKNPFPSNGDLNGVSPTALEPYWTSGPYTQTNGHEVYLSTNQALVANRDPTVLITPIPSTPKLPRRSLTPGATYYWRVDQRVDATEVFAGDIWSFKVFSPLGGTFNNGYAVWTASSQNLVFPASRPASYPSSPSASVELAGGEKESFQIVVLPAPGRTLNRVWIEGISGGTTGYPLNATNVDWKVVAYVQVPPHPAGNSYVDHIQDYLDPGKPSLATGGWWPDPLLDVPWVAISSPSHAQPLWLTISGPALAGHAGDYSGSLTINTDSGLPTQVAFNVKVHDFQLPPGAGNNVDLFNFTRLDSRFAFEPGEYRQYGEFLLEHRVNPSDGIYGDATDENVVTLSERLEDLQYFHARGMSRFSVQNVRGYAACSTAGACSYTAVQTHRAKRQRLENFFAQLALLPEGTAIRDKAVFYGYDEVSHEDCNTAPNDGCLCVGDPWNNFQVLAVDFGKLEQGLTDVAVVPQATYDAYPDVERLTTARLYQGGERDCTQHQLLIGDPIWDTSPTQSMSNHSVDDIIISGSEIGHVNEGDLASAGRVWTYGAMGLGGPAMDHRSMWWGMYQQKIAGFFHYAVNEWLLGRISPTSVFVPYTFPQLPSKTRGESVLVYPGKDGPIGSIRLANIRDGLEDKEYLILYAQKTADPARARTKAAAVAWGVYPWNGNTFVPINTYQSNVLSTARAGLVPELIARVTTQASYAAGAPIVVQFENLPGNKLDWLAIYPKNAPGPGGYLAWRYSDGTTTGTAGIHDGSVTFNATLAPGEYEVRLFFNNNYLRVDSATFDVE